MNKIEVESANDVSGLLRLLELNILGKEAVFNKYRKPVFHKNILPSHKSNMEPKPISYSFKKLISQLILQNQERSEKEPLKYHNISRATDITSKPSIVSIISNLSFNRKYDESALLQCLISSIQARDYNNSYITYISIYLPISHYTGPSKIPLTKLSEILNLMTILSEGEIIPSAKYEPSMRAKKMLRIADWSAKRILKPTNNEFYDDIFCMGENKITPLMCPMNDYTHDCTKLLNPERMQKNYIQMPYDWTEIGIYKEGIISDNGDLQTLPQSTEFTNPNSTFFAPPSTGNEIINPIELSDLSTTGFFQMSNPQHQTYSLTYPFGYHPKQPIIKRSEGKYNIHMLSKQQHKLLGKINTEIHILPQGNSEHWDLFSQQIEYLSSNEQRENPESMKKADIISENPTLGIIPLWEDYVPLSNSNKRVNRPISGFTAISKRHEEILDELLGNEMRSDIWEAYSINETLIVDSILELLIGVPSALFSLDMKNLTFRYNPKELRRFHTYTPHIIEELLSEYVVAGSYYLKLREFSKYFALSHKHGGLVLKCFSEGIQEFLNSYNSFVVHILASVEERRKEESKLLNGISDNPITLIELSVTMGPLLKQIFMLAHLCMCDNYTQDENILNTNNLETFLTPRKGTEATGIGTNINTDNSIWFSKENGKFLREILDIYSKGNQWFEAFPRGNNLLTYIYKVILMMESDSTEKEVFAMLFKRAATPYLNMINTFIHGGTFVDDYLEFFIQKVNANKFQINSRSIQNPVPVFLEDVQDSILNCGQMMVILNNMNAQEYLMVLKSAGLNEAEIPFIDIYMDISQIRMFNYKLDKYIQAQRNSLRQVETDILLSEELEAKKRHEFKLNQLHLFHKTQKAKKSAERRSHLHKLESQKSYMNELLEQIRGREKERIRAAYQKELEKEEIIKGEEEYERKKMFIKKQLEREYMRVMSKYTGQGNRETLKFDLDEYEQEMRIGKEMDDIEDIGIKNKEELVDNKVEVIPMEDIYKPENIAENNSPIMTEENVENKSDKSGITGITEIPEEIRLTIEQILTKTLDIIQYQEEKYHIQTLMLIQESDKARVKSEKKKKREEWKAEQEAISLESRLNDLFIGGDFDDSHSLVYYANRNVDTFISASNALYQTISRPIILHEEMVNNCILHLLIRKLHLILHFQALRKYALGSAGDVMHTFIKFVFDQGNWTVNPFTVQTLNYQYRYSLKLHANNKILGAKNIYFVKIANNNKRLKVINPLEISECFELKYQTSYPINIIINSQILQKYSKIFFFMITFKRMQQITTNSWKTMNSHNVRKLLYGDDGYKVKRISLAIQKFIHLMSILDQYIFSSVINNTWNNFLQNINNSKTLTQIIMHHEYYVNTIYEKCFLAKGNSKILHEITNIFSLVIKIDLLLKRFTLTELLQPQAFHEFMELEKEFTMIYRLIYVIMKKLSEHGKFKDLFILLDYNEYWAKKN